LNGAGKMRIGFRGKIKINLILVDRSVVLSGMVIMSNKGVKAEPK
jgi:hypothetical protein